MALLKTTFIFLTRSSIKYYTKYYEINQLYHHRNILLKRKSYYIGLNGKTKNFRLKVNGMSLMKIHRFSKYFEGK